MACISGEAKTKGIAERVSGMKDSKDKVERLLQQNADEQLVDFDWDRLNAAISSRVGQVEKSKASRRRYPVVFKVAAGIAAVAVVVVAVTVQMENSSGLRPADRGRAVVKLIGKRGSASVEIIDSAGGGETSGSQAAWIIISRPEPVYADNGFSKDIKDTICLF